MNDFWQYFFIFLGVLAGCATLLLIVGAILIAMPQSRFRSFVIEIMGWTAAATAVAGVISPIDAIPDFIPVAGQADDVAYIVMGILGALFAYHQRRWRAKQEDGKLVHIDLTKSPEKRPT
jgi:hypothetical protein